MCTDLEVLSDFTDQPLEGELADEQLRRLLVATNFTEGDGTGAEAVRLLHTTGRGGLKELSDKCREEKKQTRTAAVLRAAEDLAASCLRGALPAMQKSHSHYQKLQVVDAKKGSKPRLTTSGLAGGLLSAGHCCCCLLKVRVETKDLKS